MKRYASQACANAHARPMRSSAGVENSDSAIMHAITFAPIKHV